MESTNQHTISETKLNDEWLITLLLCFFLGILGVHRFYNGKIGTGILMIVTIGGLGFWVTFDFIMIAFGKFSKKDGTLIPMHVSSNVSSN